jgi:uncharacterized membrane protein YgcG
MTHLNRAIAALAGFLLALLLTSSPARAEVSDNAGILSPQGKADVENRIDRVRQQTGKTVVVETYPQIPADQRAAFDAAANKAKFYDDWIQQRGLATKAGVLLLINMSPGHAEIGESTAVREAGLFTMGDRRRVLDEVLVPALKSKNYDQGIAKAVDAIGSALQNNAKRGSAAASPRASGNAPTGTGSPRAVPTGGVCGMGGGLGGILCLVVAGLILFSIVRRIFARRNMPPGGHGAPGYGQPGYGQPGYGGGGGGFGRGMLGGLLGGMLGGAAYDHFRGGSQAGANPVDPNAAPPLPPDTGFSPGPNDFQSSSGADFDSGGGGGADFGGGGGADFGGGGGGDFGDSSGSDF